MYIFFLLVSLANLALGYFVAVKFHATLFPMAEAERELARDARQLSGGAPTFTIDASQMPLVHSEPPLVLSPPENQAALGTIPAVQAAVSEPAQLSPATNAASHATAPPATGAAFTTATAATVPSTASNPTEASSRVCMTRLQEVSVDDFMTGLSDFRAKLSALDQRVRQCAKSADTREIETCVQDFRAVNSLYLEQSSEARQRLENVEPSESNRVNEARQAVQNALATQAEVVRRSDETLSGLDIEADPRASCQTLLNTAHALGNSNDQLRDALQSAKSERREDSATAAEVPPPAGIDELTQIPSREMFDLELARQLEQAGDFCLAVIDVDHCGQLNLEFGPAATDELIKVMAKIIAASTRGEFPAARYSGQQFAVLYPGYGLDRASRAAETIRQIIDRTVFRHDGQQMSVSVSVTFISGGGKDTLPGLREKLSAGVLAAKQFGANRSFQFVNGEVIPVPPPELDLETSSYEV